MHYNLGTISMPSQEPQDVVLLDSSDEEDGVQVKNRNTKSLPTEPPSHSRPEAQTTAAETTPSGSGYRTLESRSFWRAGGYEEIRLSKTAPALGQLEHARVHPKFLHSNATSHKWAFGAIAELLDNAVDEICNGASFVKVDRIYNKSDNSPVLLFQDDGGGMNPEGLRKCMSLGYSSKKTNTTIGQYGNGFKTSTMRLGADVIVFSRTSRNGQATQSVGLLSYTFLRKTGLDDVIVPMVDFDISNHWAEPIIYSSQDDWSSNLKTILEWSPFASKEDLMQQFEDIGPHGTKLIIYNLWLNDEGIFELSFDDDDEDIRLRDECNRGSLSKATKRTIEMQSHISYRIRFSLRAYASMLYLRKFKNFKIILRGKPVEQFNIADELKYPKTITYRPQLATNSKEAVVETTLGFIKEAPALSISGFNVYHKNRLIRPFWKVTGDGNSQGLGVVGVLEANFIEPAHDKQDFERSSLFHKLEQKLKQMQLEYWRGHCELIGHKPIVKNTSMRNMQKEFPAHPPVKLNANIHKHFPTGQHAVGLSANAQNKNRNEPIAGHVANPLKDSSGSQPRKSFETSSRNEMTIVQPFIGLATESVQEVVLVDSSESTSIDQICEENIQLFLRCEEQIEKEKELKRMVEELEKELEETRRGCAQLSSHLESQRKEKMIKHDGRA